MTLDHRIRGLIDRHRALDDALTVEMKRPAADEVTITQLKRAKLRVKDAIADLERS